jgi:hypothetical protein
MKRDEFAVFGAVYISLNVAIAQVYTSLKCRHGIFGRISGTTPMSEGEHSSMF